MKCYQLISLLLVLVTTTVHALTAAELSQQVSSHNTIKITDKNYENVLNYREDYSIIIYITATSSRVGCTLCTELAPIFNTIASSYKQNLGSHPTDQNLFFGVADFADNRKFFGEIGLQSVPKMFLYKPTEKRTSQNIVNFEEFNFVTTDHYSSIVGFIIEATDLPLALFEIHEPFDYSKIFTRLAFVSLAITSIYKAYYKFDRVFKSAFLYQFLSIFAILSLTAGYMFNKIRQTPYSREIKGKFYYFLPGHQQQLGAETQLVSIVYLGLFMSCWFLISKVELIKNARAKLISVVVLNVCIFVLYSVVINFYHIKNGGYPFYLTNVL